MQYFVGDTVVLCENPRPESVSAQDYTAVIRIIDENYDGQFVGVEMVAPEFIDTMHDLDGLCVTGMNGWWVSPEEILRIELPKSDDERAFIRR